jgi:hypothetical protein
MRNRRDAFTLGETVYCASCANLLNQSPTTPPETRRAFESWHNARMAAVDAQQRPLMRAEALFFNRALTYRRAPVTDDAPVPRLAGVEIEVSQINATALNYSRIFTAVWDTGGDIVHDASLEGGGFEIRTSPACGALFASDLRTIGRALETIQATVTHRAGLHVHVDCRDLGSEAMRRLALLWEHVEPAILVTQARDRYLVGRRISLGQVSYCYPTGDLIARTIPYDHELSPDPTERARQIEVAVAALTGDTRRIARYWALNFSAYAKHRTVENRLYEGTIDPEVIIPWAMWNAALVETAATSTDEQIETIRNTRTPFEAALDIAPSPAVQNLLIARWRRYGVQAAENAENGFAFPTAEAYACARGCVTQHGEPAYHPRDNSGHQVRMTRALAEKLGMTIVEAETPPTPDEFEGHDTAWFIQWDAPTRTWLPGELRGIFDLPGNARALGWHRIRVASARLAEGRIGPEHIIEALRYGTDRETGRAVLRVSGHCTRPSCAVCEVRYWAHRTQASLTGEPNVFPMPVSWERGAEGINDGPLDPTPPPVRRRAQTMRVFVEPANTDDEDDGEGDREIPADDTRVPEQGPRYEWRPITATAAFTALEYLPLPREDRAEAAPDVQAASPNRFFTRMCEVLVLAVPDLADRNPIYRVYTPQDRFRMMMGRLRATHGFARCVRARTHLDAARNRFHISPETSDAFDQIMAGLAEGEGVRAEDTVAPPTVPTIAEWVDLIPAQAAREAERRLQVLGFLRNETPPVAPAADPAADTPEADEPPVFQDLT